MELNWRWETDIPFWKYHVDSPFWFAETKNHFVIVCEVDESWDVRTFRKIKNDEYGRWMGGCYIFCGYNDAEKAKELAAKELTRWESHES